MFQSRVVVGFGFGRRDVPDRLEQSAVVEPVDPFQRGALDGLEAAPRAAAMDDLGLEEPNDRLGEGVVAGFGLRPARGQASLSPTLPTDGSIPASARRSVYLIETYWAPASLWWTKPAGDGRRA